VRIFASIALCAIILSCEGCGSGTNQTPRPSTSGASAPGTGAPAPGKAFLDERREVPPHLEWNREVTSSQGGPFSFRVDSQGPFSVTVVTDRGYKALKAGDQKGFQKTDVLLTVDSQGPTYEGKVTVPAGSAHFIIENQAAKKVEFRLQCFAPK
jgi:hypothetical protein